MVDVEVWSDVVGYEGRYQVSNFGRVMSLKRYKTGGGILRQSLSNAGYLKVGLYKESTHKNHNVHRLVALAFIPKDGCEFVNHIDGNKVNNKVENLEWCSRSDNQKHAFRMGLQKVNLIAAREAAWKKTRKSILQYTIGHDFIKEYVSVSEAAKETGIKRTAISQCLIGNSSQSGGFLWEYKSKEPPLTEGGRETSCQNT